MSTQDAESIPVSYDRSQQGLRLLELPPELLDLLNGPDPPQLSLKSTAPTNKGLAGHVVLCTPDKTYALRQVQTSNTVFVTRPVPSEDDDGITHIAMSAFAKCGSMLELHPQEQDEKGKTKTAKEFLSTMLRVYNGPEDDIDDAAIRGSTKEKLFNDIPYSQGELEQAWMELIAFERHNTCWSSSPKLLSQLWAQLLEAATADDQDMTKQFELADLRSNVEDLVAPEEALHALMSYLCQQTDTRCQTIALDRATVLAWTGKLVLQTVPSERDTSEKDLLSAWKDALPEVWREDATLELLGQIREKLRQDMPQSAVAKAEDKELNASGKRPAKGRNWHERFKKGRK